MQNIRIQKNIFTLVEKCVMYMIISDLKQFKFLEADFKVIKTWENDTIVEHSRHQCSKD